MTHTQAASGDTATMIREMFDLLLSSYGPQHWWPAPTPTEVIIGAILTQNTAWKNVERALDNLRAADLLDFAKIHNVPDDRLAQLIRPSGTYRVKVRRIRAFVDYLMEHHDGNLESVGTGQLNDVRDRLLAIHGIGPETADAILLYAFDRPTFVVDAYTQRVLRRHFLIEGRTTYGHVQRLFHTSLAEEVEMFNEYHALIVKVAKTHCRTRATCKDCPLADLPHNSDL